LALVTSTACRQALGFPGTNDSIFPPAPAAKASIDFDGRGFVIDGKRTFLVGGDMHYSRVPHELWRDRLLRMKRAGYNVVQTYAFWNFHEPREGQWDFAGDHDLEAFLKLINELGMHAIVRVGPYVNAEWESGGLPIWLRFKPWMAIDVDNQPYYQAMDRWYEKVFAIIARNQVNHGGSVVLVQLTNEDARGAGTDLPNSFFRHLKDTAIQDGLEVPYFFSGVNHGDDPIHNAVVDVTARKSPWFSSEFWTGWFNMYRPDHSHDTRLVLATWHTIELGGTGYAHYMMVGGTNFGSWNSDEVGASYDYGAPIGEGGDLRDDYYDLKRAAWFARSFSDILANSTNSIVRNSGAANGVDVFRRSSPQGTVLFLQNDTTSTVRTRIVVGGTSLPKAGLLTLTPNEVVPIVTNYRLTPTVKMAAAAARTLGVATSGKTNTVVVYGQASDYAELDFSTDSQHKAEAVEGSASEVVVSGCQIGIRTTFPKAGVKSLSFRVGSDTVRVLAVNTATADRTWFVDDGPSTRIVIGPAYVGNSDASGFEMEEKPGAGLPDVFVYGDGIRPIHIDSVKDNVMVDAAPKLSSWKSASGSSEAERDYPDFAWSASDQPRPMGADGDPGPYAWYRFTVHAPQSAKYRLTLDDAGDWLSAFVNGAHVADAEERQRFQTPVVRTIDLPLQAGQNTIAILAAHYGRNKLYAYHGDLTEIDVKGINSSATLFEPVGSETVTLDHWRWQDADLTPEQAAGNVAPPADESGWKDGQVGDDVFHGRAGFAWFQTTLHAGLPHAIHHVHFEGVDDNATVFLNGKRLFHNVGWNQPFDVSLDPAWLESADNTLDVLVENTNQGGGISKPVTLSADRPGRRLLVLGWKMRGGLRWPADQPFAWQPLSTSASAGPRFYRAEFMLPAVASNRVRILRFGTKGLSRGMVRLNGHDLGRYPDKVASPGLYIPECWLLPGNNVIDVFDEQGASPIEAAVFEEPGSGRSVYRYSSARSLASKRIGDGGPRQ